MSSYTHELVQKNKLLPVHFSINTGYAYTIPAHWHEYVELIYLLHGSMTAVIQAQTYHLNSQDILIINSNDLHMTQIPDKDTTYILLQIPESEMHKHLPTFGQLRFQTYISPEDTGKTGKHPGICLMEMLDEYTRKEDGYPLLFLARLYELLYVLYRDHTTQALHPGGAMGRDIKRMTLVMDWVQENYQQPLTLGEAAERAGLSREYFCRMFKRYTGQTFLEYLTAERAMHLYDALKTSDSSLTLLMEQNGITNYKVFMRAFKKLYGDTPQKIRKSLSGQP